MKKWICKLLGCDGNDGSMTKEEENRLKKVLLDLRKLFDKKN